MHKHQQIFSDYSLTLSLCLSVCLSHTDKWIWWRTVMNGLRAPAWSPNSSNPNFVQSKRWWRNKALCIQSHELAVGVRVQVLGGIYRVFLRLQQRCQSQMQGTFFAGTLKVLRAEGCKELFLFEFCGFFGGASSCGCMQLCELLTTLIFSRGTTLLYLLSKNVEVCLLACIRNCSITKVLSLSIL